MKKREIQRTCAACRKMQDKRAMVRIVKTPDQQVKVDPGGRANGRGAYLCRSHECIELAFRKNMLGRALKTEIPPELREELEALVGESGRK